MSPVIQSTAAKPAKSASPKSFKKAKANGGSKARLERAKPTKSRTVPGAAKIVNTLLPSFSRQLSAMLNAGMPIVAALNALEEQQDNVHFKAVVTKIRASIENGASLSEALRAHPSIFDSLYVNMVRGGESGGQLAEVIARIASFLEASAKLRRKIKSALTYPIIVLTISLSIAVGMILFIVPVFADMYADFGAKLPGPTLFLMRLSEGMRSGGPMAIPVIIVTVIVFKRWKATAAGAYQLDRLKLRLPVFGELITKVASSRFARTFAQLVHSGVPILTALEIVSGSTGNRVAESIILNAKDVVERGEPLSSALLEQTLFPMLLVRMLSAGEKTGKVDEMLDNIADFYDDEIDAMLAGLTSMIEPFLMVFLGVIVGGILVGMFLPIFKMGEIVSM
jgi:type IV pilus assembly protein PilC|tara:strand:- start:890 stop:2074 length:1185 start_codon:yes stop_codon:yes gene_type:complete